MSSLDDRIQILQDDMISFFVIKEHYITEYIVLPFFFTYAFFSRNATIIRGLCAFVIIMRQLIIKNIMPKRPLFIFFVFAPLLAYSVITDLVISPIIYSLTYSPYIYDSVLISLMTTLINNLYGFNCAYISHVFYVLIRNNIVFDFTIPIKDSINIINKKTHKNVKWNKRVRKLVSVIETFITNLLGLTE
jgi:hypothetical protein